MEGSKKIYTLEQLARFCEENKLYSFDSKQYGYSLSVHVPGELVFEEDNSTRGLMLVKLKVCHTLLNRNGSYISEENMKRAMPSLKYRPILGYIHQLDSGEYDFHRHDIEFNTDENGEEHIVYLEKQIGCFTNDTPFLEYDKDQDKTYVIATGVIPEDYTMAADIIRRKNGTKVSCELGVDSVVYNAKEKYLELVDFIFTGVTALGSEKDGTPIGEGMLGSRLDIQSFSRDNNSVCAKYDTDKKLIEVLEKLDSTLSNIHIENSKEGGNDKVKFNELLEKYGKTVEDVTFDYSNMTDDELEAAFKEAFEEVQETGSETVEVDETEEVSEEVSEEASEEDPVADDDGQNVEETSETGEENFEETHEGVAVPEKYVKSFEISHEDIRYALYGLLDAYEEADNEWYFIIQVFDDYFNYENWTGDKIYGQKYIKDGDNVAFSGERWNLHRELLTDAEYAELQSMRSNYSAIQSQLAAYQAKEETAKKKDLVASSDYSSISDKEDFSSLVKSVNDEEDGMTFEELKTKCDEMLLNYAKKGALSFSANEKDGEKQGEKAQKKVQKYSLSIDKKKKSGRYGGLKFN